MNEEKKEEWNSDKIAEDVLGLLFMTSFSEGKDHPWRAWKGHDWDALDHLHTQGYISNPKGKAKSIVFSDEGFKRAREIAERKYKNK